MTTENQAGESQAPTQPPAPTDCPDCHGLKSNTPRGWCKTCGGTAPAPAAPTTILERRADYLAWLDASGRCHDDWKEDAFLAGYEARGGRDPRYVEKLRQIRRELLADLLQARKERDDALGQLAAAPVSPGEPPAADDDTISQEDMDALICMPSPIPAVPGDRPLVPACGEPNPILSYHPCHKPKGHPGQHGAGGIAWAMEPKEMVPALDLGPESDERKQFDRWVAGTKCMASWTRREIAWEAWKGALATPPASPPSGTGRELWMLETRGILDPRYWADKEEDAEDYIKSRAWLINERPRLVRMVEASNPKKEGDRE